jgi:hypothetical protein
VGLRRIVEPIPASTLGPRRLKDEEGVVRRRALLLGVVRDVWVLVVAVQPVW